ncbi:MAG: hypothetical protein EOL86_11380 [Deltaproteobacteria bacterium]|nr:hypothetical protein [Deltaproteobacteria bacterium]
MGRLSEEARQRAKQIRDEALSRLNERESSMVKTLVAEVAALKGEIAAQRRELAELTALVRTLTDGPAAPSLASSRRPLSGAKRRALEKIRELRAQDLTFSQICREFRAQGVPTLSGEGEWSKGTLWNLWKNHSHQLDASD